MIDKARRHNGWDLKDFGYIDLCRAFYAAMRDGGAGIIINISGSAAERLDSNYIAGLAGNASLNAFSRTLGSHSFKDGIRVVAFSPGAVKRICIRLPLWPARRILSRGAARLYRLR